MLPPGAPATALLCKINSQDFLDSSTVSFREVQFADIQSDDHPFGFVMSGPGGNGYSLWDSSIYVLCDQAMARGQVRGSQAQPLLPGRRAATVWREPVVS